jgi:hypothetical protein
MKFNGGGTGLWWGIGILLMAFDALAFRFA